MGGWGCMYEMGSEGEVLFLLPFRLFIHQHSPPWRPPTAPSPTLLPQHLAPCHRPRRCRRPTAPQVWYGVPACATGALEEAMRDALPHLFAGTPRLLYQLVTALSPAQLRRRGVPVYRVVHEPGSFVVTMPNSYHAGFNCGFNVAEVRGGNPIPPPSGHLRQP